MNNETLFEKRRLRDRFREIATLAGFTLAVALISIAVMNLLIFPVTVFAVNHTAAFNFIVRDLSLFIIVALLAFLVGLRVYRLRKEGLPAAEIARYLLKRPFYYVAIFFFFIITSSVLVFVLYLLLSNNYYLLYKLTNS
jgi:hypothetical protein